MGGDGQLLVADSSTSTGLAWAVSGSATSGVKARLSANQVIPTGVPTDLLPWVTSGVGSYNTGDFDTTTGVYTAPRDGRYRLDISVPVFMGGPATTLTLFFININVDSGGGFVPVEVPIAIMLGVPILDSIFDSITYTPSTTFELNQGDALKINVTATLAGPGPLLIIGGSNLAASISIREL